jgi:GT2 family glycosyltransferase
MQHQSELRAVGDALNRRGSESAIVECLPAVGGRRVVWPLPKPEPLVSIIIPTRDRAQLVENAVSSILTKTRYSRLEIIIADNDSALDETKTTFDRLRKDERVEIIPVPGPFNYSAINNIAAKSAKGQILILMNNDVEAIDGSWLDEMVSQASRAEIGVVGAKLLYADGRIQHAGIATGPGVQTFHPWRLSNGDDLGYFNALSLTRSCIAVTGACLALRRELFDRVSGLDEVNLQVAFNDVDLCLKIGKLGYRILWTPFATLYHLESISRGLDDTPEKIERARQEQKHMMETWFDVMDSDPYHNPNTQFTWTDMMTLTKPKHSTPWVRYMEPINKIWRIFPVPRRLARFLKRAA